MNSDIKNNQPRSIPIRIVIGVTGHRVLENESLLRERVQTVLDEIGQRFSVLSHSGYYYTVLTPLAEGADQLVAEEVLAVPHSLLEVVLPFKQEIYRNECRSENSKQVFDELLRRASRVKEFSLSGSRAGAYEKIGRYIVDRCDVLIALWDGEESRGMGGTAEIVDYARNNNCPIYWIHTKDACGIYREKIDAMLHEAHREMNAYNCEEIDAALLERHEKEIRVSLESLLRQGDATRARMQNLFDSVLPHFSRADLLAIQYQRAYYRSGSMLYSFAAVAVVVVTFQTLFATSQPEIILLEVLLMIAILAIIFFGKKQRWHSKWIDCRFLAERLRSALFMDIAGIAIGTLRPPRHLSLSHSPKDWMILAFHSVWDQRNRADERVVIPFNELQSSIIDAWVVSQTRYYNDLSERFHRRHTRIEWISMVLFALTFIAAGLHLLYHAPILSFCAIVFPTVGSALAAIKTHREYLRNAKRAGEMKKHLEEITSLMRAAQTREEFLPLMHEAEETMLHENEDWRVIVRLHDLELPA